MNRGNRKKWKPEDNLISFGSMSPERHRELSAMGGKASGEVRRERAETREAVQAALYQCYFIDNLEEEIKAFLKWKARRKRGETLKK